MLAPDDLRFFAAVATATTLAAAARALDVSPPAVTQRLRALEVRLGVQLVDRRGRLLALTNEGELLAERGREILGSLGELTDALSERRSVVTGHLRLAAPLGFGRRHIAPVVGRFQAIHPQVRVDLILTDRLSRSPAESWDIAVHVGQLDDATPGLSVRHLAPNERILCCSPDYLARQGAPRTPEDLREHACIVLRENDEDVTLWRFRSLDSRDELHLRVAPRLASNDGEVVKAWALSGYGIIVRSEWDVADDLRAGRLIKVLQDHHLPAAPIVALLGTRREARAARTRRFLDELTASFQQPEWRRK